MFGLCDINVVVFRRQCGAWLVQLTVYLGDNVMPDFSDVNNIVFRRQCDDAWLVWC